MSQPPQATQSQQQTTNTFSKSEKTKEFGLTNIQPAKALSDAIRTSLEPRGMAQILLLYLREPY